MSRLETETALRRVAILLSNPGIWFKENVDLGCVVLCESPRQVYGLDGDGPPIAIAQRLDVYKLAVTRWVSVSYHMY